MALELRIVVRLGNDAMQSGEDLADALDHIAGTLRGWSGYEPITDATHAKSVFDLNGNRVGQWKVHESDD